MYVVAGVLHVDGGGRAGAAVPVPAGVAGGAEDAGQETAGQRPRPGLSVHKHITSIPGLAYSCTAALQPSLTAFT